MDESSSSSEEQPVPQQKYHWQANEEDQTAPHRKHLLKSRKVQTADSLVTKHVTWPHEVGYAADGKATAYHEMSMPLFTQGYLIVIEEEKE